MMDSVTKIGPLSSIDGGRSKWPADVTAPVYGLCFRDHSRQYAGACYESTLPPSPGSKISRCFHPTRL